MLLSGCAASGKAKVAEPVAQTAAPTPVPFSVERLDTKLNVQFDWWKLLQSPPLNMLIEQSFAAYPTVASAQETLLKAQQSELVRAGYFIPPVSVSDAANGKSKLLLPQTANDPTEAQFIGNSYYGLHAHRYTVGYLPEMLRIPEQPTSKADAERRRLQLDATYRTLADNLIACAVQEASLRAQMTLVRKIVAIDQSLLSILRKRQKAGLVAQEVVILQQSAVASSEQVLQRVKQNFEQTRELLRLLLGVPPGAELPETFELAALQLTEVLPLELPSALIEQRPDVRVAQATGANHESTASAALKNIEETLFSIHNDGIALKAALVAEQEDAVELEMMRKQYAAKQVDYQDVLIAEQSAQLAALRSVQARTQHLGDAVALYHALGGAWWNEAVTLEVAGELTKR
jgi:outer membrane protein TolC